jgi:hypothetical protein
VASTYPGSLDGQPATHADAWDAIAAVQTELGTNPSGSAATVAARIAAVEASGGGGGGGITGTGVTSIVALSQAAYNALSTKVSTTLYVITG